VIVTSRALNPELKILVRARYLNERSTLEDLGATAVCYEEAEAAVALADLLLREVGADTARLERRRKKSAKSSRSVLWARFQNCDEGCSFTMLSSRASKGVFP
jgi:hypothetical protein